MPNVKETLDEKVERLKKSLARAKARASAAKTAVALREAKKARADDTRRKILIGAAMLAEFGDGLLGVGEIYKILDNRLKRDEDRALVGLPLLSPPAPVHVETAQPRPVLAA